MDLRKELESPLLQPRLRSTSASSLLHRTGPGRKNTIRVWTCIWRWIPTYTPHLALMTPLLQDALNSDRSQGGGMGLHIATDMFGIATSGVSRPSFSRTCSCQIRLRPVITNAAGNCRCPGNIQKVRMTRPYHLNWQLSSISKAWLSNKVRLDLQISK